MGRLSEDEAVAPKSLLEQMCSFITNKYLVVSNAFPVSGTLITFSFYISRFSNFSWLCIL